MILKEESQNQFFVVHMYLCVQHGSKIEKTYIPSPGCHFAPSPQLGDLPETPAAGSHWSQSTTALTLLPKAFPTLTYFGGNISQLLK